MKVVVVSGGFDPVHSGHIAYFNAAKKLGDKLIVALNSDDWLINKKGKFFKIQLDEFFLSSPPTPNSKLISSICISGMFCSVLSPPLQKIISSFG